VARLAWRGPEGLKALGSGAGSVEGHVTSSGGGVRFEHNINRLRPNTDMRGGARASVMRWALPATCAASSARVSRAVS
jgi:hypothetical protein